MSTTGASPNVPASNVMLVTGGGQSGNGDGVDMRDNEKLGVRVEGGPKLPVNAQVGLPVGDCVPVNVTIALALPVGDCVALPEGVELALNELVAVVPLLLISAKLGLEDCDWDGEPVCDCVLLLAGREGVLVSELDGVLVSELDGVRVSELDGVRVMELEGVRVNELDGVRDGAGVVEGVLMNGSPITGRFTLPSAASQLFAPSADTLMPPRARLDGTR